MIHSDATTLITVTQSSSISIFYLTNQKDKNAQSVCMQVV